MATLRPMPAVVLPADQPLAIGRTWNAETFTLVKASGEQLGRLCDRTVGGCLAQMLGGIPVVAPANARTMLPPQPDCVEVGPARVIGGIRPQNFDVACRPECSLKIVLLSY